ncbi:MAG: hypothetical protein JEY99_01235 [Spirochaetales bacterium]|nr:hypothetical protein [Spirochaetales bacterium]
MSPSPLFLGIDIGSVSISMALVDANGNLIDSRYGFHNGKTMAELEKLLSSWKGYTITGAGSASAEENKSEKIKHFDPQVCTITGAKKFFPEMGSLMNVGGEKFSLTLFSPAGDYRRTRANTSCAAGTGGFLDQQARRLGLNDSSELSRLALENPENPPKIASRCSVFAKTDLIHSQQEGYTREEICAGLCKGVAENLGETLFPDNDFNSPLVFSGGVALNGAVARSLETLLGEKMLIHPHPEVCGALGAALLSKNEWVKGTTTDEIAELMISDLPELMAGEPSERQYHFPPLILKQSFYPDFKGILHYTFQPEIVDRCPGVETDLYSRPEQADRKNFKVYFGLDIGSTSTKAALLDINGKMVAGFYTRTQGQPLAAFRGILETIHDMEEREDIVFQITGAGSTGSGRKFLGSLMGADIILDEISAHARAAYELDPGIDTIIEIGGQDSKFTTMNKGMVTFSQMNTVCAAGTGSFIEEQAQQLGVQLSDYAEMAMKAKAPRASDRCTVFMERDLNHYLNRGYKVEEILAAVLHSVRENYLQKVASTGNIGEKICFQGATAKNKALVAAFEEKLKKPIHVSPYCHLTGAMGVALTVREEIKSESKFRGKGLFREEIPVRKEQCNLCGNHCRLRIAEINGETCAFGFLCGRDYQTKKFVKLKKKRSLLEERDEVIKDIFPDRGKQRTKEKIVGIPLALQLSEELHLWKTFFEELEIPVITSRDLENPIKRGKALAGAEFCSPIHALYGHVDYLADISDTIFLPHYLEQERSSAPGSNRSERVRKYCYYTQFAPTLALMIRDLEDRAGVMTPVVMNNQNDQKTVQELYIHLNKQMRRRYSLQEVQKAYQKAKKLYDIYKVELLSHFDIKDEQSTEFKKDIRIGILGRPYTILDKKLNSHIPEIIADLNIESLAMDQIPPAEYEENEIGDLLSAFHWNYAARILRTTLQCARTPGLYPILVTSFKCGPDSFLIEYYQRIMNRYEKPYLILQLDDHDSSVGYETRIEAGVRAFRNHHNREADLSVPGGWGRNLYSPKLIRDLTDKTIFLPNWDPMAIPLIAAALNGLGYRTRVLDETDEAIRASMTMNTGQCIPVNVIAQEYMNVIRNEGLAPEKTALWMSKCQWACNIHLYPYYIKSLLEAEGMEKANVYWGEISYIEFSPQMSIKAYVAYLLSGILRKVGCALRPYETIKGSTDQQIEIAGKILIEAFEKDSGYLDASKKIKMLFDNVEIEPARKPKVAIFGDLYTRDNPVINQDLVRFIEKNGGEAIITPYNDYVKIIAGTYFDKWRKQKKYGDYLKFKGLLAVMELLEKGLHKPFDEMLGKPFTRQSGSTARALETYSIKMEQEGESKENLLKIIHLMNEHPDINLLVQANPAFCCPSLVTEAMGSKIEELTGIPMVSLTYDGTGASKNDLLTPYLKFATAEMKG